MNRRGMAARILCCGCSLALVTGQQQVAVAPVPATAPIVRWYQAPQIPPPRLGNSERLRALIRGGAIYLTVQDAIALAIENNLDLEVARYNPLIAQSQLTRFQAGGALPGVPSNASQAGAVASGQGVAGSEAAAGVVSTGGTTASRNNVNAQVSQIGPVVPVLDPVFQDATTFSHTSVPQFNSQVSFNQLLISNTRAYNVTMQQGLISGGTVTLTYSEHYLNENAPTDLLNPSYAPNLSISFQHNLLQGFGVTVNSRNIRVQEIGVRTADLNFRVQVENVVAQTLNAYYGLVADDEDVRAKQTALDVARTLAQDTAKQIQIGTQAPLDQISADSQVATSERDVVDAQTAREQQELQLKNMISRTGASDPLISAARIVPVDRIVVPATDDLPPMNALLNEALANRADLAAERLNVQAAEVSSVGTQNGVLPFAVVFGNASQAGLSGTPHSFVTRNGVFGPDPYFVGGIGTALGQVFRRDFPSEGIGDAFGAPLRNRVAQADYGIEQLQLRQTQLNTSKDMNRVQVDIRNDVVAMRQARSRYQAAQKNLELQRQLFEAEQKKQRLGTSTPFAVTQQERDLNAAQSSVIAAEVAWSNARVALDQALGRTLKVNNVSIDEARTARVARPPAPPAAQP
ncbi:MAG TPA: TolC family protein [Bryobacteraceae bacterium]|nr:TolC family protein [Bryobacteraceae bacterium]